MIKVSAGLFGIFSTNMSFKSTCDHGVYTQPHPIIPQGANGLWHNVREKYFSFLVSPFQIGLSIFQLAQVQVTIQIHLTFIFGPIYSL